MAELTNKSIADIKSEKFQPVIYIPYGKKMAQIFLIFEFWLTIVAMIYINKPFYDYLFDGHYWLAIITPLSIYGFFWTFAGLTLLWSWIIYSIVKIFHPPIEGEFDLESKEFHSYMFRFWISYYAIWVARAMPLPWADMIAFRMFGVKVGKNVVLYDSWIDPEFIEIGDYVMLSLNTSLYSHGIVGDKFIVKKVVIEKNGIVGAEAIVAPGSYLEEGAILGAGSSTSMDQKLGRYLIHAGNPANQQWPIKVVESPPIPSESAHNNPKTKKKNNKK